MFLIRLAQSCTLSLHFAWCSAGFGPYSRQTFSSACGKEPAFRNESPARRFHFPLHNIFVRAASSCGRNYPVSAFCPTRIRTGVRKEGPVEAGPSCHELKPDLLVIFISCADRSTDLAAWGASAVHIDVGGSFTHRLHDFCKVRAGRNALTVGSNYIGRCNCAGYCAGGGVRARRRIWKAGRRSASSTCSGATEKYHNPADFFGEAKMDVRKNHLGIQIGVGDCVAEGGAIRNERGSERTARLRCDRSFAQAAKARFESVGIVIGGNRNDAEAKYDR